MKITIKQPKTISTVMGTPGPSGVTKISLADDVDTTNLETGSLLIYDATREKWISDTLLVAQTVECGEY